MAEFKIDAERFSKVAYRFIGDRKTVCDYGHAPCYMHVTFIDEDCRECIKERSQKEKG